MTKQQPEAWRLAECLEDLRYTTRQQADEASAMLRNQHAELERLRAELEAVRNQEPTYWGPRCAINGGYTTFVAGMFKVNPTDVPLYLASGAQPALGWLRAVDEAMVCSHLGTAEATDDYATAKRKLNELICWNVAVEKELGAQPAPIQEVYDWPEGATHYQPQQKAFYKRVSACEWYVWSRITDEPLHWSYSPGTMDSAEWIVRAQPAPSGLETRMYQDAEGKRPVTGVNQPVGLVRQSWAPKRKPLAEPEIFKAYTTLTGKRLPYIGSSRAELIAVVRMTEAAHGITGDEA